MKKYVTKIKLTEEQKRGIRLDRILNELVYKARQPITTPANQIVEAAIKIEKLYTAKKFTGYAENVKGYYDR